MSSLRLILTSLAYHWRIHLAVALGVAAATAVLTGALLVGDSMRGSLRDLTIERLGRIDEVLVAQRFFRTKLAEELAAQPEFSQHFTTAVPAILLQASVENPSPDHPARAGRVNLIGCNRQFWELFPQASAKPPEGRQIVLNQPLAEQLGVAVGEPVILRLPRLTSIPADSPLGRKTETVQSLRLTVSQIVPATGAGRFDLRPSQQLPRNAFVSLDGLSERLERPGQANAILVAGNKADVASTSDADSLLGRILKPSLSDYGIRVERTKLGYINITSERMLLEPAAEQAILKELDGQTVQPALTYLANSIACRERQIPYSTITAIDLATKPPLGPLLTPEGKAIERLRDDEIVLNTWAADDLQARPGDRLQVTYFEPDSLDGEVRERTAEFRLAAIAELAGAAADPAFTPEVPGVTDQASIADWNPPFPFDAKRIRKKDEAYWDVHRATPKAFVSLPAGEKLWASRLGKITSLRVAAGPNVEVIRETVRNAAAPYLGFNFQPVKRQGLAAAAGTTPFSVLFLGFSFFIILAAVMLIAILFRLGIETRASQLGILLAIGWGQRRISRWFAVEGLLISGLGGLVGVVAGIGYAALMLEGLQTWWLEAIVTPFLRLHITPASLVIGYLSGVVVAFAAVAWSVRHVGRVAPRQLLAGVVDATRPGPLKRTKKSQKLAWFLCAGALALSLAALAMGEELRAGAFFGAGSLMLAVGLMAVWRLLRSGATGSAVVVGSGNLARLAMRNAARNPGRSTLTIGAIAAAAFLIVSVSAFRLDPASQGPRYDSGNGGFGLLAETDLPVYHDPNTPAGQAELGFSAEDSATLKDTEIFPLRVKSGEDASCLNLYRPRQPRILGVSDKFIKRGGFAFSAQQTGDQRSARNPWLLLSRELPRQHDAEEVPRVPAILDEATAKYSLHLWRGVGETLDITDGHGQPLRLVVVGLLKNSLFQGDVLIGEQDFRHYFPEAGGYRFFLAAPPSSKQAAVQDVLQRVLGDYGFAAETTGQRLARLLAVQNTYLSTFQTLGGLGLLLGTFGLAAVELRNVLERRRELALLRAVGFRRRTLARLVMLENAILLLAGLGCGVLAAAVAVLPHFLLGGAAIPWVSLGTTLLVVLVVGLLAGLAAVRAALAAPVLGTLREE
jgi:ABC-type antimicrobial peptide transport system permease subunit